MELSTERLLLRPYKSGDLPHIQRYAVRPQFYEFLPIPAQTPESVAEFLSDRLALAGEPDCFNFAIEPIDVGHIVGALRLEVTDRINQAADLGFALDSEFQNRGYMTEAVACVIRMGFNTLSLHRIWATADVQNGRSWNLLERVGMVREGRLRDHKLVHGRWRESYIYSILSTDVGKSEIK
jgi:RimJ/RimL family protein N-acetyltransferase